MILGYVLFADILANGLAGIALLVVGSLFLSGLMEKRRRRWEARERKRFQQEYKARQISNDTNGDISAD